MKHILFLILFFSFPYSTVAKDHISPICERLSDCITEMQTVNIEEVHLTTQGKSNDEGTTENKVITDPIKTLDKMYQQCWNFANDDLKKCEESYRNSNQEKETCIAEKNLVQRCKDVKEEMSTRIDIAKQELTDESDKKQELARDAREEVDRNQRELKRECRYAHDSVKRERDRIEGKVQKLEDDIQQVDTDILAAYAAITTSEDEQRAKILKAKEDFRKERNRSESNIRNSKLDNKEDRRVALDSLRKAEQASLDYMNNVNRIQLSINNACSKRFQFYIDASKDCYDKALKIAKAEKEQMFKNIQSGYQVADLSNVFNFNSKNVNTMFQKRILQEHKFCYRERVGENLPSRGQKSRVQVSCDIATLKKRNSACEKAQNNSAFCPQTPEAEGQENALLIGLTQFDQELTKAKQILKQSKEKIEQIKKQFNDENQVFKKELEASEKRLEDLHETYAQKIQMAENKLTQVRSNNENKILSLEKTKVRLQARDPAKHFEESIWTAKSSCCSGPMHSGYSNAGYLNDDDKDKSNMQQYAGQQQINAGMFGGSPECQQLNSYLNNKSRWQYSTVRSTSGQTRTSVALPTLRTSGVR